ncbi:MAG: hypothetical protein WCG47_24145 [Dermatophilaceae bacterium]
MLDRIEGEHLGGVRAARASAAGGGGVLTDRQDLFGPVASMPTT